MQLIDYLRHLPDRAAREAFAVQCGTNLDYLYQVAGGHRRCGGRLARRIVEESKFAVTGSDLRPDIFGPATASVSHGCAKA